MMKKFLAVCACLILLSFAFIPRTIVFSQKLESVRPLYVEDRIIVKLRPNAEITTDADTLAGDIIGAAGVRAESLTHGVQAGGVELVHLDGNLSVEEAVSRAKADPRVEYAEPDYIVRAMDTFPNDPLFSQMWGLFSTGC
jgi:hypothetical protein